MAGRRGKGSARRGKRGRYEFTYKRKAALSRAQAISARKRRGDSPIKKIGKIAGAAAAVGAVAYLGHRHRGTIGATASNWRNAVQPGNKEQTRINNAVSVGSPSRTTVIGVGERARADAARQRLAQPRPDRKIYTDDSGETIDTEAMTNRSVAQTMKAARRRTQGSKTGSLTGTPGGTKTPPKATGGGKAHGGFTDEQWQAILAFDAQTANPVTKSSGSVSTGPQTVAKNTQSTAPKTAYPNQPQGVLGVPKDALRIGGSRVYTIGGSSSPKSTGEKIPDRVQPVLFSHAGDAEVAITAAMNANPGVSRETVMQKLNIDTSVDRRSTQKNNRHSINGYDPKSAEGKRLRKVAQAMGFDIGSRGQVVAPKGNHNGADNASYQNVQDILKKFIGG